jgi:hypothetical protein
MTESQFHTAPAFTPALDLDRLSLPYAGQTRMRLTITSGLANARVRIDPDATALVTIDCGDGPWPRLAVSSSEVRVSWSETLAEWLRSALAGEHRDVEIVLHASVEWALVVRGGLSRFEGDLAAGKLAGIEISGGVSDARLDLPAPEGPVPVRVAGGVSEFALRRPAAAGVALAVKGGIADLRLDDQSFGAIGGAARLATGVVHGDASRYLVEISGGASGFEIVAR